MDKIYTIGRLDRCVDGSYKLAKEFTTEDIHWRVKNKKVYYVFSMILNGEYYETNTMEMPTSKREAISKNLPCYYKIIK